MIWEILQAVHHLEDCCETRAQQLTLPEIRSAAAMYSASMRVGNPKPFSGHIRNGPRNLNPIKEFILKLVGRSHHTLVAIIVCLKEVVDKYFPNAQVAADLVKRGQDLTRKLEDILNEDAVLIFPCTGFEVPYHDQWLCNLGCLNYMSLINMAMMPATACPLYLNSKSGMPIGVQVAAGRYQDRLCLAVARELEAHFGGWKCPGAST